VGLSVVVEVLLLLELLVEKIGGLNHLALEPKIGLRSKDAA
jgi:hypothetical protein